MRTAAINGRSQPFHHGHLEYLLGAQGACDHLIIGVTNPDPSSFEVGGINPHRGVPTANPLTYFERKQTIEDLMLWLSPLSNFSIVPFPIHRPEIIRWYLPADCVVHFTVYDAWGDEKIKRLSDAGHPTNVLWRRPEAAKITTGSEIRGKIIAGAIWQHLVPAPVYDRLISIGFEERVRTSVSAP